MKRSQINHLIRHSRQFFEKMNFILPPWGYWAPEEWKKRRAECCEIFDNMLGWDLTDFGKDDFQKCGLILFTLRNGNPKKDRKPYAEKIMIVDELQETPMHFHWSKMEDIINRGGGNLVLELYKADRSEGLSPEPFSIKVDGCIRMCSAGERVVLTPGESICFEQGIYHRFYGEQGKGKVLVGEVSQVNDDTSDNRFLEQVGRFPVIEEDEVPMHLLVSDYATFV